MQKNILLTGATGNLGAYATRVFLKNNNKVYVISRSLENKDSSKRVLKSLLAFGVDDELIEAIKERRLIIVKADISDDDQMESLNTVDDIDQTWHFASTLKYLPKDMEEIYQTNIRGTKNLIGLHKRVSKKTSRFFYISTSYAAGRDISYIPEARIEMNEDMSFHNEYERSKLRAENLVLDQISKGIIRGNIFRPSVVIGDKKEGLLINYHGFYHSINTLFNFKKSLEKNNESLTELFFETDPNYTVNLIPIEDAIGLMYSIAEAGPKNGTVFNVVNRSEIKVKDILKVIGKAIDVKLTICKTGSDTSITKTKNWYDKLMDYGGNYFMPYLDHRIKYDTSNSLKILKKEYNFDLLPSLNIITKTYVNLLKERKIEN